jgi:hypothetical protein
LPSHVDIEIHACIPLQRDLLNTLNGHKLVDLVGIMAHVPDDPAWEGHGLPWLDLPGIGMQDVLAIYELAPERLVMGYSQTPRRGLGRLSGVQLPIAGELGGVHGMGLDGALSLPVKVHLASYNVS